MTDIAIYKDTDVDITITVTGILYANITAVVVSLERPGATPITFTSASGAVTIGVSSLNLRIEDGLLMTAGDYLIRITATENSNERGLTPTPAFLKVI